MYKFSLSFYHALYICHGKSRLFMQLTKETKYSKQKDRLLYGRGFREILGSLRKD